MTYPGGKGRLWQDLVSLMPPHDVYIETHLGGGAVMQNKEPARRSVGIDMDPAVLSSAANWRIPELTLNLSDAVDFLCSYEFTGGELVYADPPYMASTKANKRYYRYEYSDHDHLRLLDTLVCLKCPAMISGYTCELYENALRGWDRKELLNITHAGPRREIVWANFQFSAELHDYSQVGGTFRERERIKRKAARWVRKLQQMPSLEQRAVLAALLRSSEVGPDFATRLLRTTHKVVAS